VAESQITARIIHWLRAQGAYAVKVHGSASQESGVPDILFCIKGAFGAIEVKADPRLKPTPLQSYQLEEIERAGGATLVASSLVQVQAWLDPVLHEMSYE